MFAVAAAKPLNCWIKVSTLSPEYGVLNHLFAYDNCWGSDGNEDTDAILGCDIVWTECFEETYCFHLQGCTKYSASTDCWFSMLVYLMCYEILVVMWLPVYTIWQEQQLLYVLAFWVRSSSNTTKHQTPSESYSRNIKSNLYGGDAEQMKMRKCYR
jgi:hypothetical protein